MTGSTEREPPAERGDSLRFGSFELSVSRRELRRHGRTVDVGRRGMDLLLALVADAGTPVAKARLMQAAWNGRSVEHSNLTVQIATLRRHLGDDAGDLASARSLIRTVPGYGYVFTGSLRGQGDVKTQQAASSMALPLNGYVGPVGPVEPLTRFIGRDKERRALSALLQANRLVTLTGLGGVGKTRLVMRLQREISSGYADGVTLIDLAPLAPPQVDEAVAAAVGAGGGNVAAEVALVAALESCERLLILDNAEHVAVQVAQLLGRVLPACPRLTVLVTSRDSLGLAGEVLFRLSPLELPPQTGGLRATAALAYDAVRLLVDRVQALLPGFALEDEGAEDAANICRRLDGIALAIEMAVPLLEVLSLRQLAERLQDRFGTVSAPRGAVPPRQRTLRAMFDWSWDLLGARERRLLQLLAIPAAGTTLEAIEASAVADGLVAPAARHDVLGHLTRLVQSSLVTVTRRGGSADPRYRLLETTRQYAIETLPSEGWTTLSRLHAGLIAALFECAEAEWPITHSAVWRDRYEPDADNLRACLQWAFSRSGEDALAMRLTAASFSLWWELPGLPLREARGWYALALARVGPHTPPEIEARLRLGYGWTDTLDGDATSYPAMNQAVELFREGGDRVGLGASLWRAAGTVIFRHHVPSASALLKEALEVLEGQPASKWHVLCQVSQADLLLGGGAPLPALARYDRALAILHDLGYSYGLMVCGGNRSYALFDLGRVDEAISALRDLLAALPPSFSHPLLSLLAVTLTAVGRDEEALSSALQSLAGTVAIGMSATLARSIEALSLLTARTGNLQCATRLLGFALARHPADRARLGPRRAAFDAIQTFQAITPSSERARLLLEGAAWSESEAVAVAMDLA